MTLNNELFGKKVKDFTEEECKQYARIQRKKYYYKHIAPTHTKYKDSFCYQYFGKRKRDLDYEELKEFNRLQKQISRERLGRN